MIKCFSIVNCSISDYLLLSLVKIFDKRQLRLLNVTCIIETSH